MALARPRALDRALLHGPLVLALLPVVLLPQLVGGVHPHVAVGAALVELGALTWFVLGGARAGKYLLLPWTAAPLALGLVATIMQLVPWPRGLLAVLSPAALERVTWMTELLPEDVRAHVLPRISLDPPESAFAAVRLLGALALFLLVADAARRRHARTMVYRALLMTGAAMFAVALGHLLLNVHGAWGQFTHKSTLFYAPMVNPNQLARVFGALALVLVCRALAVRSRTELAWFAGVGVLCGAGVFLTLSRGAMLAFLVGGALLVALLVRERFLPADETRRAPSAIALTLAPAALLVSAGIGVYLARETLLREVASLGGETLERSKAALYRPALSLLDHYATAGVGNNAFGVAFTERATPELFGDSFTFTHVENVLIAALVEHGVFVGGALIVLACSIGILLLHRLRERQEWTPLPALGFLVVSDLFDFVLESTAGLYLAATLLALATSVALDDERTRRAPARATFVALAGAGVALLVLGVSAVQSWRPRMDARIASARGDARARLLDAALASHPADGHYAYLQAVAARERGDLTAALRWANRALVVWPAHSGAHVEAARALAASSRLEQAMLEYRAAWEARGDKRRLLDEVAQRTDDIALRRRALPERADALAELAWHVAARGERAQAVALIDDALVLVDAGAGDPSAAAGLRVAAANHCLAIGDAAGAQARLAPLLLEEPRRVPEEALHAHLLAREAIGGVDAALEESRALTDRYGARLAILGWQLDAAARLGRYDEALKILEQVKRSASSGTALESFERREAALHAANGDRGRQLRILERIAQRNGRDIGLQLEVASLQLELGLMTQARASWSRAAREAPTRADVAELERKIRARELANLNEEKPRSPTR